MIEVKGAQLFFRELGGNFSKNNVYLVCGLVKTTRPVSDGDLYTIEPFTTSMLEPEKFQS